MCEKGYWWKRAEAYVPSRDVGDCTAALKGTQENLYCMCMFIAVYRTVHGLVFEIAHDEDSDVHGSAGKQILQTNCKQVKTCSMY